MTFRRRLDRILSFGKGWQLLYLAGVALCVFILLYLIAVVMGWGFKWQDILGLYLDAGNFSGAGQHDWFRLIVTFSGVILVSSLLITVFNNIIDNVSQSVKAGYTRYRVRGHILIIGSGKELFSILSALREQGGKEEIVILTHREVEPLEDSLRSAFSDPKFLSRLIFYRGARNNYREVEAARPQYASKIYLLGEDREKDHDSLSIECCDHLKKVCEKADKDIPCFTFLENGSTFEVYMHDDKPLSTPRLKIDLLSSREYSAEQIIAWSWFLPLLTVNDPRTSHFIILGTGPMAKAVAFSVAHNSHYPALPDGRPRKTLITVIGKGMREWLDNLTASREKLFSLSSYSYISGDGTTKRHDPERDILDIEWEFIEGCDSSPLAREYIRAAALSHDTQSVRIAACHSREEERIASVLHLPREVFDKERPVPVCIYLEEGGQTIRQAIGSGNYGKIFIFGPSEGAKGDPLLEHHSARGMLINGIYAAAVRGKENVNDFTQAWYERSEADKFSSLYCANALVFRWECFDTDSPDREPLYEAEHRRWMTSKLLMGLDHSCIMPYDELPDRKIRQHRFIIDEMLAVIKDSKEEADGK